MSQHNNDNITQNKGIKILKKVQKILLDPEDPPKFAQINQVSYKVSHEFDSLIFNFQALIYTQYKTSNFSLQ
jgi:hypothetical protein